jgi:heme exporter protein CcmD
MNGIVDGGWAYVIAAYGVSFVVLAGYVVHTIFQARRTSAQAAVRPVTPFE